MRLTGKQIDAFAQSKYKRELPNYYNERFIKPEDKILSGPAKFTYCKGALIAARYNGILQLVKEKKAVVKIGEKEINITYTNGKAKIARDLFVDTFLLPELNSHEHSYTTTVN